MVHTILDDEYWDNVRKGEEQEIADYNAMLGRSVEQSYQQAREAADNYQMQFQGMARVEPSREEFQELQSLVALQTSACAEILERLSDLRSEIDLLTLRLHNAGVK